MLYLFLVITLSVLFLTSTLYIQEYQNSIRVYIYVSSSKTKNIWIIMDNLNIYVTF